MFLSLWLVAFIKVAELKKTHWGYRYDYFSSGKGVQCLYSSEFQKKSTEQVLILISSSKEFERDSYESESVICPKYSSWSTVDIKAQIVQDYTVPDMSQTFWYPLVTDCMRWTAHEPQINYIHYPGSKYCSVHSKFGNLSSHLAVDGRVFRITAYHDYRIFTVETTEFDWYIPDKAYHVCMLNDQPIDYDNNGTSSLQECIQNSGQSFHD